ncbi:MAG: hypothetical protein RBS17_04940 [Coriobacteriia bacterium]|nr:hypothetical protein [Coriobacteriia bacterium]
MSSSCGTLNKSVLEGTRQALEEVEEATPLWIEHVHAPNQGRDHLGLGTVASDQLLEKLSPGIRALTIHPRYFSFYAFVIEEFWQHEFPRDAASFKRFYRYCELMYSVGVKACDRDTHRDFAGVVGSDKTGAWAREHLSPIGSNLDYIQTSLGGYGLYYKGRLQELEVSLPAGETVPLDDGKTAAFAVDVVTPRGKVLAAAFREAVKDTRFYRDYLGGFEDVPFEVAAEFGKAGCLCGLTDDSAPDRRPLLDMFMSAGRRPEDRRDTFRYFLDLADQTQGYALTQPRFRRLVYFGADGEGAAFVPSSENLQTHRGWRLYQAREYYAYALNTLWAHLCAWGIRNIGDLQPIALSTIRAHFLSSSSPDVFAEAAGVAASGLNHETPWGDVVSWYASSARAESAVACDSGDVDAPLHEARLIVLARDVGGDSTVAAMIGVLALVCARYGDFELTARPEWMLARFGHDERLSLDEFLRDLRAWGAAGDLTLGRVVTRLLERYVIAQHMLISSRKMPENTFRFEREGDGLRFYEHANPVGFMDSRFFAISSHLADLGLCGEFGEAEHPLSSDGRALLEQGTV